MSSKSGSRTRTSVSQSIPGLGRGKRVVEIIARNPCPMHGVPDDCKESIVGIDIHEIQMGRKGLGELLMGAFMRTKLLGSIGSFRMNHTRQFVVAFAQLVLLNIYDTSQSIVDVSNTTRSSLTVNNASTAPYVVAGTTGTAPTFSDYALGDGTANTNYKSNGNYAMAATVGSISSNYYTITAVITNGSGSNITYKEVGTAVTVATYQFLTSHDQVNLGAGYQVSPTGTLTVTITDTWT